MDDYFFLAAVVYLGKKCPVCGEVFATFEDLMQAKFGAVPEKGKGPDIVHKSCWDQYAKENPNG